MKQVLLKKKSIAKATSKRKPRPQPEPQKAPHADDSNERFAAATQLLRRLIQSPQVAEKFDPQLRTNSRMVYPKGVTLWMLILQRLGKSLSMEDTVSHIITHDRW
jgi:hypothetical protein